MPVIPSAVWIEATVAWLLAWGIMMAAMMLPSATPMIVLFNGMYSRNATGGQKAISTTLFTLVYVAVWLLFGIPVYLASLLVGSIAAGVPAVGALLPYAVAAILLIAGLFQFTPLKRACLRVCQHPFVFMMGHWRSGYSGALRMAAEHSAYCVGCCWALMAVLVAAGAMSLPWVLVIAIVVFAEKLLPQGIWAARVTGGVLVVLALLVAFQPGLAAVLRGMPMQ